MKQTMRKQCENCQSEFTGRSDKRFCCIACKNQHNLQLRRETRDIVKAIDAALHRNREILAVLLPRPGKETVPRLLLSKAGFNFDLCTRFYYNREGKRYHYVYDYAWMEFSQQDILIVRKA